MGKFILFIQKWLWLIYSDHIDGVPKLESARYIRILLYCSPHVVDRKKKEYNNVICKKE